MPQLVDVRAAPVTDAVLPEWAEVTIVFRLPSLRVVALDGWKYGTLVVHATWDDPKAKPFTVTHRPSKLAVFRGADVEEMVREVERVWARCPRAWAADEVDAASVPPDVVAWCRENR